MTKFFEEFETSTNGKFKELKFNSAFYDTKAKVLTVRFIINTFVSRASFGDDKKAAVLSAVQKIFPGVQVKVEYINTFADDRVVKTKVLAYFNENLNMVFKRLNDDNISVKVKDGEIRVEMNFETPTYHLLKTSDVENGLFEYLNRSFNEEISIKLTEIEVAPENFTVEKVVEEWVQQNTRELRVVQTTIGERIYSRNKIVGLNQSPIYIKDVKEGDNVILCGKIFGFQAKEYVNKKYDPANPTKNPEKLPLFSFTLDDTTGKIETTCFPKISDVEQIKALGNKDQIACIGKVAISKYSGALSYTVDAIFRCEINFDSINLSGSKSVPDYYTYVKPEPYQEMAQSSITGEENEVPDFLKDKTIVVYDFEATGKVPTEAEPIEIAAARVVNGKIVDTFQSFCKPSEPISDFITELTSITNEMVQFSPSFSKLVPDFYKYTRGAILCGHNISGYDYIMLAKYADEEGYNFNNELLDTLLLARDKLKEFKRFDLPSLTKNLNISHENAHRAIADVYATVELLRVIAKRM